ncbi:MAG: sugar nucleotide-binding protein [Pseudomonadota bacterium]
MSKRFLIVGADAALGTALTGELRARGHEVLTTSRRASGDGLLLDLEMDPAGWPSMPPDLNGAFIAAAMTSQKDCAANPAQARRINVEHTLTLIARLRDARVGVVFPSTNLVLPCLAPTQSADTPRRPMGLYATQKAEVEQAAPDIAVCRLAKVLTPNTPILLNWLHTLSQGGSPRALTDLMIAPVSLPYATAYLANLMEHGESGIWQMSGAAEISYFELACELATHLGYESGRILPARMADSGVDSAAMPKHPSLDAQRAECALGFAPQPLNAVVNDLIRGIPAA